jgi:hypothetical protein
MRRVHWALAAATVLYTWSMAKKRTSPGDEAADAIGRDKIMAQYGVDSTARAILDWRIDNLTRAGFDELRANTLAAVGDWRRAIELVEDGCAYDVAADICL